MNERRDRAKSRQETIRRTLLREWDPIGIASEPQAQDECDSYVPQVFGMLIRRKPLQKLIDFFWWVETEHMELYGDRQRTERVADLLLQLPDDARNSV